jgi:hypothetical protein
VFKKREKVNMSDLNEKLAQEAAELINGGEWRDGKWYSDGHRDAWRRALKPAASRIEKLEAALKPFAKWADWHDDAKGTDVERCFSKAQITVGELRAARKALEEKDD